MPMSKWNSLLALVSIALLASSRGSGESVSPAQSLLTLTLGTATPGGGFPVYGAAFAQTVHEVDPTITIETRNTKGSAENVPLLEEGKLDLALVQGEAAYAALAGIGRGKPANI